jgi:hypothetical protein
MSTNGLTSLKLLDYSDRELLLIVMEQASATEDGFATTHQISDALGVTGEKRNKCVGSRLAALRRMGVTEKRDHGPTAWTVSPIGQMMAKGKLDDRAQRVLAGMGPDKTLLVIRQMTQVYKSSPESAGHLLRREWIYGTGRR